jgi:glycosyltransferase involved in cell wall biosynthesis
MNKPLVSICIPTYNGEKFITEAMDSAIKQTYRPLEIVVSDDVSKDATLEIIKLFQSKTDIPIHIFTHQPAGIGANWNHCIKKSKGEYIKFLFQDDILESSCIEKMVEVAVKNKNIGMVYCKRDFLLDTTDKKNSEWVKLYSHLHLSWKKIFIIDRVANKGTDLLKDENLFNFPENKIGEPTAVLLKKEVFDKVGYFSEVLKQTLDIEFWYRLMKKYDVVYIDEKLLSFRLHNNQATFINAKNELNETEIFYYSIFQKLFWYLHFKTQMKLFYKFNIFRKFLKKIQFTD